MLMPAALTMTAASRVPVYLDTQEMDSPVQVISHLTLMFTHTNYNMLVTLVDNKHKLWITSVIVESVRRKKLFCTKDG